MYINLNTGKSFILVFIFFLLVGVANGANDFSIKSNFFSQKTESFVSLPVRISPVLVEAPSRYVDLLPVRTQKRVLTNPSLGADIVSYPLTGLPVDLYEFPLLKFKSANQYVEMNGLELELDTRGKGMVDALVRIGDPTFFPDMLKERIDFSSAEIVAKDLSYKIKRGLGLAVDDKWRYTAINNKLDSVANGFVSASFEPGSALLLQRTFAPADLSKTPWLKYEYELPKGLPWVMQVTAKVDIGGFNPKLSILSSEPVKGGGKQKILVNLLDLLQKADHDAKDGRLVELFIRFTMEEAAGLDSQKVRINLGKLDLYYAQMSAEENGVEVLLVTSEVGGANINLLKAFDKRIKLTNNVTVLGGRLVSTQQYFTTKTEILPKINLLTQYREKIPELFVGAKFFLDELSSSELDAVLDQKIFYQKRIVWESGQSDVIFRNSVSPMLPLLSFAPNTTLNDKSYLKANFLFEDGRHHPLSITLLGTDVYGKPVTEYLKISTNIPIRLEKIRILKKATLSFWQHHGATIPYPVSFVIRNIQVILFDKTSSYRTKPALAYAALVPDGRPFTFWRANPARFDINLSDADDIQIVQTHPINTRIVGNAKIKYKIESAGENVTYYMRVHATDQGGYNVKEIPMDDREEVPISNMYLHSLEIIVRPNSLQAPLVNSLLLENFELVYENAESTEQNELLQLKNSAHNEITYLTTHKSLHDPTLAWLKPAYENVVPKTNLLAMHKLDATLSYSQIIAGGKSAVLPDTAILQGRNNLNYVANEGVSVLINPSFLKLKHEQQASASAKKNAVKPAFARYAELGFLVLALAIVWLGVKTMTRWEPLLKRAMSWWPAFLIVQFLLLNSSLYVMFYGTNEDALSWGGLMLTCAYALAVHYKLRPFLREKWAFFRERLAAPYFLLFFILIFLCAVMLVLKFNTAAENMAVMGYYLLVTGVVIEFICFAKEAKIGAALSTKETE